MGIHEYSRDDLRNLDRELEYLSPHYRLLVLALIGASVERLSYEPQDIKIDAKLEDDAPLPKVSAMLDASYTAGRRRTGGPGQGSGDDDGWKVGGRVTIDLDRYRY